MSHDLATWLPRQRWYGDKDREIAGVRLIEAAPFALAEVQFRAGRASLYQVGEAEDTAQHGRWLELLQSSAKVRGRAGVFEYETWDHWEAGGNSRLLGAEQSNTSVLYHTAAGEPSAILKLFRRLQAGENPEIEMPRALARSGRFDHVPRGWG
ncbi:MAG: maltokinase N-terminal cap-like domain-containing protein, partial [Terriglobales bacterium]